MKNFQNYKAEKYADTEKFVEVEDGIYRTADPCGEGEVYVTSLTFELEDDNFEGGCSPQDIPQAPFEDLLDEFTVYVNDFYEEENAASEVTCYQEFGSPELEDIQKLRTIIGKRFYAVENPDDDRYYTIKIADMSEPRVKDFEFEYREDYGGVITKYLGSDKAVIIPAEIDGKYVRAIGADAFANRENLESAVISDGIQVLGWDAFSGCKKLKNITIPESVTAFMGRVFVGTPWLNKKRKENPLVIVNGLLIDGRKCEGDVVIPKGVKEVVSDAFSKCKGITSVSIPDGVTEIGHRAFQGCKALTSVTLPNTVTLIGEEAFEDCKALENLNVPDELEDLYDFAFDGTPWLENKRRETPLVIIGKHLLDGRGMKGDIEIPDGITHICYKAFYYNREITSVTIPESVTEIGRFAFQGCSALENVELVWGLTKISEGAFRECAALEEIKLPRSVTEIEEGAFRKCGSLKEVDLPRELPTIASGTFCGCSSLDSIYIPDSVTEIGDGAFKECTSMRWARLPDGLEKISSACFQGCASLEKVDIAKGLKVIEKEAFDGCSALEEIGLPDSISEIGVEAFLNCASLKEVYLPESLTIVQSAVFANCTSLEKVHFEDGLKAIGNSAFHSCGAIYELDLPDTLLQINPMAFAGCMSLEEVEIPDSVVRFDLSAFKGTECTVTYKGKEFSFVDIRPTASVETLRSGDKIFVDIFGKVTKVEVISTGDNQFDEDGQHKPDGFALSEKETAVLNDFLKNVKLADFIDEITNYCNERYEENGEEPIQYYKTPLEIRINTVAVNVCEDNGEDDPEIALMGDCECDEGGICIGFRDGEFVGIEQQDWLL